MHRELYRFGGMTLALESPEELTDSALCRPFRTAEGTADHTIGLTFSDRLPQPPEAMTGMPTASFTARMISQSTGGAYI